MDCIRAHRRCSVHVFHLQIATTLSSYEDVLAAARDALFASKPGQDVFVFNARAMFPATYKQPVQVDDLSMFMDLEAKRMKPVSRLLKSGASTNLCIFLAWV